MTSVCMANKKKLPLCSAKRVFYAKQPEGSTSFSNGNAYNKGLDTNSREGSQVMNLRHTSTTSGHVCGANKVAFSVG